MNDLQAIVAHLTAPGARQGGVLATLVTVEGSSYRQPGARLLLTTDGARIGSISGGCLEEDVLERARVVGETGRADLAVYDTTSEKDFFWGVGLGCHGRIRVLIERLPSQPAWVVEVAQNLRASRPTGLAVIWRAADAAALGTRLAGNEEGMEGVFFKTVEPPPRLVIFGAGDDAQPLARMAKDMGWRVAVADPRPAFATPVRFPYADAVVCAAAEELVARANPDSEGLAIVMTHHYVHDVPVLRDLLRRPLAYLGLLGPKKRAEKILDDLAAAGLTITPAQRTPLHAPAGLDIGGDSPGQVALSIIAEMQAVLSERDGRPLSERNRPIHG